MVVMLLCFFVGIFVYKKVDLKGIPAMFVETFHTSCDIMIMLMGSLLFGFYLSWARIPQDIASALLALSDNKYVFIFLSMGLMLIMGMLMDATAMLLIVTPILYPVAQAYDIDLIQFGILELINGYIGSLTPPVGGVMYTVCNILGISIPDFFREAKPFIAALLIVMLVLMFVPQLSTFIPNLVYG